MRPLSECGRVHGPNWSRWLARLKDQPEAYGLEIGTFKAESAVWMLENIFTHPTSTYVCIDPWEPEGSADHKYAGIDCTLNESIARAVLGRFKNVKIFKGYSNKVLTMFGKETLDFIYVDGPHDSMNTLRDAVYGFDLLKSGGTMVFDDYEWRVMPSELDRPKLAIDAFTKIYSRQLTILEPRGWQIAIKKL